MRTEEVLEHLSTLVTIMAKAQAPRDIDPMAVQGQFDGVAKTAPLQWERFCGVRSQPKLHPPMK